MAKKAKKYRLSIIEIDDNGNEREMVAGDARILRRVGVVAEIDDERCCEILVNQSVDSLARLIFASDTFRESAQIAAAVNAAHEMQKQAWITDFEDMLIDSVEGELQ